MAGQVVPDDSKDHSTFLFDCLILNMKAQQSFKTSEQFAPWQGITFQKTWIFIWKPTW